MRWRGYSFNPLSHLCLSASRLEAAALVTPADGVSTPGALCFHPKPRQSELHRTRIRVLGAALARPAAESAGFPHPAGAGAHAATAGR